MTGRLFFIILLALLSSFIPACTPPTTVPIRTVCFGGSCEKKHDTLLVFLPGIQDRSGVYADRGFIEAAKKHGVKADLIGVDAHVGYYKEKKLLGRVKEDVVEPAKKRGYRYIWLVGISLGGFGAIWYDAENPGDITGLVSLSPYLGEPEMIDEVSRAGGLRAWQPARTGELDDQHRIWRGLKNYELPEKSARRVFLGYGLSDKFAFPDSILAAVLPREQVFAIKGDHDWSTWRRLWEIILERRLFDRDGGS
jgi:pimeloyl-ACP methyl ester carboxylesterase